MIARFIVAVLLGLAAFTPLARAQTAGERAQLVVELYTSQGCTQCPRANRLLGTFAREEGVLALTFAVGIWDYLGWPDTFAEPEFNDRQRAYSRALRTRGRFTPQLVLNGQQQLSGSDWEGARVAVDRARAAPQMLGADDLRLTRYSRGRVRITLGANARAAGSDVWLVAYDPGPLTVLITGGLNINRSITHYNVVQSIERIDTWNGAPTWYDRSRCSPECAVIVQQPDGGAVLGAVYTSSRRRR